MRTRLVLVILATFALAACSGGGGGSNSTPSGNNNNGSTSQSQSLSTQEVAQTGTEAAFGAVEQGDDENGLYNGNLGPLVAVRVVQSTPDGSCHNGVEKTVTVISSTEKKYEVKYFYDKACTILVRDVIADVVNNGSGETITRVAKNYAQNGLLLSTRVTNFSITGSGGNFTETVTGSLTVGTSTTPAAQYGRTHTVSTPSGSNTSSITGNSGHLVNNGNPAVNQSFGHAAQLNNATKVTDSSGNVTFAGGRSSSFYKGPLGSLTLASSSPFTISGGSLIGTASVQGSVTFDNDGDITAISVTATLLNGYTVTMSGAGNPITINGTVKNASGATIATFVVDGHGNGIITYSNGSQGIIYDWHIVR
jgi:hypothetical protein